MHDGNRTGLCRYLRAKPAQIKQTLLSAPPVSAEPETPGQASPNMYKGRRGRNRGRRRANRHNRIAKAPSQERNSGGLIRATNETDPGDTIAEVESTAAESWRCDYFERWKQQFFTDGEGAP
jgi:hypothetical protein